jgi:hypothetical protein
LIDNEGNFAQKRFKSIVQERYIISKHTHTSYEDTHSITPVERRYLLEFIEEDLRKQNEMYEKAKAQIDNRNR